MKTFLFLVVVLVGCANAKPYPAKRSSPTCSAFPKQLSGRMYVVTVDDSGSSNRMDMQFNLDMNLQIMQTEATVVNLGISVNMLMDFKGEKMYFVYTGEDSSCLSMPLKDQDIQLTEFLKDLSYETSGKLGLNGALVDLYSLKDDETVGLVTLEGGNQCIPVSFATKGNESTASGSFLDLKTTSNTGKLKIPENCRDISRRSIPALIHSVHLKEAVKRRFPWIDAPVTSKKRGFPWIDLQDTRKRGFPWPPIEG